MCPWHRILHIFCTTKDVECGFIFAKFEECLNSGKSANEIRRDMGEARKAGVTGTPTFFFAVTDPASSKVKTIARLSGAQPYDAFKAEIDRLLAEASKPAAEAGKGQPK